MGYYQNRVLPFVLDYVQLGFKSLSYLHNHNVLYSKHICL